MSGPVVVAWFVVRNEETGQYLRAFLRGLPDWCALMSKARRYTAKEVIAAVRQARGTCVVVGVPQ